jgi:imidazolonepropionase-like amidohydrolase
MLSISVSAFSLDPYTSKSMALIGVNVIPMTGDTVTRNQTILVKNGVIDEIGDADKVKIPRKSERLDMQGAYVVPGLIDLHVHFNGGRKYNAEQLSMYLANGVTAVLNMKGNKGILNLIEQVDSGEMLGPEVFTTSPILGNISPTPNSFDLGKEVVQQFHQEGYDFLKVYNFIPPEGYQGIAEAAKELDMTMVGHTVRSVGLDQCIESGQHIAHLEEIIYGYFADGLDESKIPEVTQKLKASGVSIIATLIAYHNIIRQVDDIESMLQSPGIEFLPTSMTGQWQPDKNEYLAGFDAEKNENYLKPTFKFQKRLFKSLLEAEVPLLAGTDAGIAIVVPGYSLHDELKEMVAAGMTPYQALSAATKDAAQFLKADDEMGTLEVGKRADFVVLEKNPLENIEHSTSILGTAVRGKWMPKAELDTLLEEIRRPN